MCHHYHHFNGGDDDNNDDDDDEKERKQVISLSDTSLDQEYSCRLSSIDDCTFHCIITFRTLLFSFVDTL